MQKNIAVIKGDGIGPEIVNQAILCLGKIENRFGHNFNYTEVAMGGDAIDKYGDPLPDNMLDSCKTADAVLLGAIGGPKWDSLTGAARPESGLLKLRKAMGLYANLRPAKIFPALVGASSLKPEIATGIDMLVVRELTGGIYFGKHTTEIVDGQKVAQDIMEYSANEISRILHIAFKAAQGRRKKVTSVDKANVLDTSRLWRDIAQQISKDYPDVEFENMLVDNAAMQLVRNPAQFDIIVTENMFGDILSDEASMVTGSIGLLPSASLGEGTCGLFEPIHGSAPDIAGMDKANPVGTILSAALMLRYSFNMEEEAKAIEESVDKVLNSGFRTPDIMDKGSTLIGCSEMGEKIASYI